jgi:nicotinate phosphoribosyltransferase
MSHGQAHEAKPLFPSEENMAMITDLYELTMAAAYFESCQTHNATFELFARNLPENRSYLLTAGLEQALHYLANMNFRKEYVDGLRSNPVFRNVSSKFFDYLENWRFTGDVWAIPEGTVIFANEPLMRVTAPIIDAQLVETYLLCTLNFQTLIATKASRIVEAARGKGVVEFGARRAHGPQAALLAARASFIGGCIGTSNVLAAHELGIPAYGTMAHSFVMNFDSEREAFEAFCKVFPSNRALLIDTYDTVEGAKTAISLRIAPSLVRLDSGDRYDLSVKVRRILDEAGFKDTKIFVSGDLNEYIIEDLASRGAPIDAYGVGTELVTSRDDPALSGIYKLVEIERGGMAIPRVKVSEGKRTLPSAKQVYRRYSENGEILEDIIALAYETPPPGSIPLLVKVMEKGKIIYELPSLLDIQKRAKQQLASLPKRYKKLRGFEIPPIRLSPKLEELSDLLFGRLTS